jgi:hypothetical protein
LGTGSFCASLRILEPEVTIAGDMGRMLITVLGMIAEINTAPPTFQHKIAVFYNYFTLEVTPFLA